jgi:rhomboid protease GluP
LPPEYRGVERAHPIRVWLRIPLEKPFLTQAILITLVAIFVPMFLSQQTYRGVFLWGAKINREIYDGEWWRLITATFLHAQTPIHIFFNGYALYMIGMDLEAFAGRWRFVAIYFISGLAGSVASLAFSRYDGVGASGAIFGLIGALGVYFGLHRRLFGRLGQAQFRNIIAVIALNVGLGFSGIFPIDNAAHIGGLVAGAALGYVLCPRYALGAWRLPNVRDIQNTNRSVLVWVATALIALDVIFAFFVVLLLARKGIYIPRF